ncbi:hypothetical protein MLD38_023033 [Melastoma candidum]|uniref:Uncharacterized protein n=1 Tax=Melastoma candidum TaxID=119954 RepID=A0ACB9QL92_9MYRT|nr:hypothetical protein MLD38_023033 [Melastoma candidum]
MAPLSASTAANSASDDDLRANAAMDMRKRKRMVSNRESARRSRMRKQKRLDDLAAEAGQLVEENRRVMDSLREAEEGCARMGYENLVLRAQMDKLGQRRKSLEDIIEVLRGGLCSFGSIGSGGGATSMDPDEWYVNLVLIPVNIIRNILVVIQICS